MPFTVLEGIDGAGTTLHALYLKEYLTKKGLNVISTFEPWTSKYGMEIRRRLTEEKDPNTNALDFLRLFVKDSALNNKKLIKPGLKRGNFVLSDRYRFSSFVYQQIQGISLEDIAKEHEKEDLEIPDITFLLDVCAETALERKGGGQEKFEKLEFLKKARDTYLKLADMKLKYLGKVVIIDTAPSIEEVNSNIFRLFDNFYKNIKS